MSKDDVADYFDLGGERKERTISRYENNSRVPSNEKLKELAKLYNIKKYIEKKPEEREKIINEIYSTNGLYKNF